MIGRIKLCHITSNLRLTADATANFTAISANQVEGQIYDSRNSASTTLVKLSIRIAEKREMLWAKPRTSPGAIRWLI